MEFCVKQLHFCLVKIMYKTKRFGLVSSKTENQILAELERDLKHERSNKHESTRRNQDTKSDNR